MRVPLSLLRKLVEIPVTPDELAKLMNGRMAEVEHLHTPPARDGYGDVAVVELMELLEKDEEWGRWRVQSAAGERELVVGLKYGVAAGERYLAILAGGTTPSGESVGVRKVGPFSSQGMLVSEEMIAVGDDATNPLPVTADTPFDANAYDLLELDDHILEFDLEPNRPDLFSLMGMARDLSAIFDTPLRQPEQVEANWEAMPESELSIDIQATDRVARYVGLEVAGVKVGPSPMWLQNAVRKLGMRPINNIVDAANLAMLEIGQPMHTFDRATLKSGSIGLRMARGGEKITTLDGVERELTDECLLVTDGDTPIALAGVMGDADSEITATTSDLLIESATFDMATVRRCSRRLALRTEASLRFEKGLPSSTVIPAVARLAWLLREVAGAEVTIGRIADAYPNPAEPKVLKFDPNEARERMALDVPDDKIRARFARLGIEVDADWTARLPDFRADLQIQADLNEEVGRIHGYEHVVAEAPRAPLAPPRANPLYTKGFALREALTGAGFDEVYLGIWFGDAEVKRFDLTAPAPLELKNPLTHDLTLFRTTSLPDLLNAVGLNRKRMKEVRLFEIAKVYMRDEDGEVMERHHLSGALSVGGKDPEGRGFYEARDTIVGALSSIGIDVTASRPSAMPDLYHLHTFHPGRWAALTHEGAVVGVVGELHPRYVKRADLPEAPVTFHIDLEALLSHRPTLSTFTPPARFPSVEYHINVLAPNELFSSDLLATVGQTELSQCVRRDVRAVYRGANVPDGMKRVTLELEFNNPDRSLTHDEAQAEVARLKGPLEAAGLTVEF